MKSPSVYLRILYQKLIFEKRFDYWDNNGQKKSEATYKDGKRDGLFTTWYDSGQKKSEETYKDGEPDGLLTHWYMNGTVRNHSDSNYILEDFKNIKSEYFNHIMAQYKMIANFQFEGSVKAAFKHAVASIEADYKDIMEIAKKLLPMSMAEKWIQQNPNGTAAEFKK